MTDKLADALTEIERLTAGREIERTMIRNAGAEMAALIDERDEARRDRDRFARTIEFRVKELDEARATPVEPTDEPQLGLATTRQLLAELTARIEVDGANGGGGGGLDYTTVAGRPEAALVKPCPMHLGNLGGEKCVLPYGHVGDHGWHPAVSEPADGAK